MQYYFLISEEESEEQQQRGQHKQPVKGLAAVNPNSILSPNFSARLVSTMRRA